MLRYEGPTLAHSEADVWHALIWWRDRLGTIAALPRVRAAHAALAILLEAMGNHAYTAWVEPVFLAADRYLQAPDTPCGRGPARGDRAVAPRGAWFGP